MPRRARSPEPEQKHRLSLAELAAHDDACSDAMIDNAFFKSQIRKNRTKYTPLRGIKTEEIPQILLHKVIVGKDPEGAEKALLKVQGIKRYRSGLKSKTQQNNFLRHLRKYIYMYMTDCAWEVSTTNRYTITTFEASVTARQRIKQNQPITHLVGTLVPLTAEESAELDTTNRNFSIVLSGRKKNSSIFLGPARFANHDCDANARLVPKGGDSMEVVAIKNIEVGDEITVSYGDDYFGPDNIECLCHTCEVLVRNGWAPRNSQISNANNSNESGTSSVRSQKRKRGEESSSQRTSPLKFLKRGNGKPSPSKLHQSWTPPSTSDSEHIHTDVEILQLPIEDAPNSLTANELTISPPISPGIPNQDLATPEEIDEIGDLITGKRRRSSLSVRGRKKQKANKLKTRLLGSGVQKSYPPSPMSLTATGQPDAHITNDPDTITIKIESTEAKKFEKDPPNMFANDEKDPLPGDDIETTVNESTSNLANEEPRILSTVTTTEVRRIVPGSADETITPSTVLPSIEPTSTTISSNTTIQIQQLQPLSEHSRTPGDYLLTRKLLAQPHDRWVHCLNELCGGYFVQPNGYQTRRECPRCERHSMLYGFPWPKTDPDKRKVLQRETSNKKRKDPTKYSAFRRQGKSGKGSWVVGGGDEEERVMDHRIVHRFVLPEDEKIITRKGLLKEAEMARLKGEIFEEHFGRDSSRRRTESEAADRESLTPDGESRRRSNRIVQYRVYADV